MEQPDFQRVENITKLLLLWQDVMRRHQHEMEVKLGASFLEIQLIQFVVQNRQQKMKDVAENFYIKLSTLTTIIDKAEKNKLLKRVASKDDRRVVYLEATKRGEDIYNKYIEATQDIAQRLAHNSADDEQLENSLRQFVQMPLV